MAAVSYLMINFQNWHVSKRTSSAHDVDARKSDRFCHIDRTSIDVPI